MKQKKIHFVGIKGVGQTALAIIAKEAGVKVTGSDVAERFITDVCLEKAGIECFEGFSAEHISNQDLIITTGANGGFDNVEVQAAKTKGIRVMTKGEAVGAFMDGGVFGRKFTGISVAGSHGKTTTTAMIATVLKISKFDPSYTVGTGEIPSLGNPGHFGKGKFFVAEADEYANEPTHDKTPQFLFQNPKLALFTNIELDHPDIYPTVDSVRKVFLDFAKQISRDGVLVANGDDAQIKLMLKDYKGKVLTFGFSPANEFVLKRVSVSETQTFFWVERKGVSLGQFVLKVPGEHNALNALGASVIALETGLTLNAVKEGLLSFAGSKRRLEYKGKLENGAILYDDYAHHPTEIQNSLKALSQSYPKHKIICIFQPHTYSRTKKLLEQFSSSFSLANTVVLIDIFPSAREQKDVSISSQILAENVAKFNKNVVFLPKIKDVIEYVVKSNFPANTIVVTMGAGDIYQVSDFLIYGKTSN